MISPHVGYLGANTDCLDQKTVSFEGLEQTTGRVFGCRLELKSRGGTDSRCDLSTLWMTARAGAAGMNVDLDSRATQVPPQPPSLPLHCFPFLEG